MYRIGIIGSDNTHADAFAKMINLVDEKKKEYLFPDFKVTSIFGLEKERTLEVAKNNKIIDIVEKPEDMIGMVDAVMVVLRHGDLHLKYSFPFICAHMPTWIDKPFTISNGDAKEIFRIAGKYNTLIAGGSSLKYIFDVLMIKNILENGDRIGKFKTAVINFPATLENEYGGIYFYGAHLAEMTLKAFGHEARSVIASENNGCVTAIVKYDSYQITMNFIQDSKEYYAILYGDKGTIIREIDTTGAYQLEFEEFAKMIYTGKQIEKFEHLYASVELLNAVVESYKNKTEVKLFGLEFNER